MGPNIQQLLISSFVTRNQLTIPNFKPKDPQIKCRFVVHKTLSDSNNLLNLQGHVRFLPQEPDEQDEQQHMNFKEKGNEL